MNIVIPNVVIVEITTVIMLCATSGCGRTNVRDYHVFDESPYRVNEFTSRLANEIVRQFGKPDREVLGSPRSGLSEVARMPLSFAKLPEDIEIKEWWYFRDDAYCVVWMKRNDKGEWSSVADLSRGPGIDCFLWPHEEPEGPWTWENQYTGWTDESVVEKFGKPHRNFSNYNKAGLWCVEDVAMDKGRKYMKIENPEMKQYYYDRTNEHVQCVFWFVKDSNSVWKVVYDMTAREGVVF